MVLLFLISSSACYGYAKVHDDVSHKLAEKGYADVIIVFENSEDITYAESGYVRSASGTKWDKADDERITDKNDARNPRMLSGEVITDVSDVNGFNKRIRFDDGYSGELTSEGLENLIAQSAAMGITMTVYDNTIFQLLEYKDSGNLPVPSILSALNVSTASVNANYSWNVLNVTGRGVRIAILDTGIDYRHPDLGGCFGNGTNESCKVYDGYDYYYNDTDPIDDGGHGTHVAGIIGASGSKTGVAPDAIIYSFKVCSNLHPDCEAINANCGCPTDVIRSALDDLVTYNISIASMSLGALLSSDPVGNSGKYLLSQEVDEAIRDGVIIVSSAGNSGSGVSTVLSPGDSELVITVGAVNDNNTAYLSDDVVWRESSRGPSSFGRLDPDIVAPGYEIVSTFFLDIGEEWSMNGTSMAAPFVSGAAALMIERYPSLNPSQVRAILMQSASNIAGKVFEKGAGELDVRNALVAPIYATVEHVNTYMQAVSSDRWEFVLTPYTTSYANITIINDFGYDFGYNFTFNISIEDITNLENNITLNKSQISIQNSINITSGINQTISVNFTLSDFNNAYATTYGGIILLNGTGNNGTSVVNKTLRIPVVITIPIMNYGYLNRTMLNPPTNNYHDNTFTHEDVYTYCYYNPNPRNMTFKINWTGTSNDLDFFLYNSTGDIDTCANGGFLGCQESPDPESETLSTLDNDTFKWFRIDGWAFTPPLTFNINITDSANDVPVLVNITPIGGSLNSTNTFLFYRPNNLTLNISYYDLDNDTVTVSVNDSINDSGYIVTGNGTVPPDGYIVFSKAHNASIPENSTARITIQDAYGGIVTRYVTMLLYSTIVINNYYPSNNTLYLRQNDSQNFILDVVDVNNNTLYYYWSINGTVNETSQNFTLNTTNLNSTLYGISVLISTSNSTNETNETLSWNVYVDGQGPLVSIQGPAVATYNNSRIDINYSVSDTSGVSSCWYSLNGTASLGGDVNITDMEMVSCLNTSIFLGSGQYSLMIYSNDTLGNIGYSQVQFIVNDTINPNITSTSPSGSQSYTTNIILRASTDENATCKYALADVDYDSMNLTFENNVTAINVTHNATYDVGIGAYLLYVRCRDMSNNTNNESSNISFTISSPPSDDGDDDGGGGGGGGGGSSAYYDPNSDSFSDVFGTLEEGETNISIDKDDIPVSQLTIKTDLPLYNVTINLSSIVKPEVNYTNEPVNSYIVLEGENIPVDVDVSTDIYFSVTFKWLNKSNITKNDVMLLLYDYDTLEWKGLLTTLLKEDTNSVYYVAESPKFGLYAISSNHSVSKSGETVIIEPELNKTLNKTITPQILSEGDNVGNTLGSADGLNSDSNTASIEESGNMLWLIWAISGTLIVAVISVFIMRKRQKKESVKEYVQEYEKEFIEGADKELRHVNSVFTEKIPKLPEEIDKELRDENIIGSSKESFDKDKLGAKLKKKNVSEKKK
ncbi:MAG: S8 family serine peptidase [Candidatus Woesearchaeota archaeon]